MNEIVLPIQSENVEPLKVGNEIFKSVYDWKLTEKELEKAARELGETEEKKKTGLKKLKKKLSDKSTVKYRQDDFYLLRFLRVRKYDVDKAYQNVKSFYELRKKQAGFFIIPPDLKSVQELNLLTVLPYTDEEGNVLFWFNVDRWPLDERTFEEVAQSVTTVADIIAMNPACQINGAIAIHDYSGMTMKHFSEVMWNGRLWAILSFMQYAYPWRIKKFIALNTNRLFRFLFSIAKPFLQRKVAERCILLGSDMEELHRHINPVLLPKKLKGTLEDEDCNFSQHVLNNLEYLKYERSFMIE